MGYNEDLTNEMEKPMYDIRLSKRLDIFKIRGIRQIVK